MRLPNLSSFFKAHEQTIFLVAALIALGGVPAGIVRYFDVQETTKRSVLEEIERKKLELNSASIDRSLAGQSRIELSKMIVDPDKDETSVYGAKEFSDGHYSVIFDLPGFSYERSTEAKILHMQSSLALSPQAEAAFNALSGDLWFGKPAKVSGPGANAEPDKPINFFPAIIVEVWNKNKYIDHSLGAEGSAPLSPNVEKLRQTLESNDNQQLLAQLFVNALVQPLQSGVTARRVELRSRFAYIQLITDYHNIIVGEQNYTKFFVVREIFTILAHERIYFITVILPTSEPFSISPYSASINQLLESFRILP